MFCPNITVRHPVQIKQNFSSHVEKSYYYARGFGYIMRKHPLPRYYIFKKMTLPFAGMIIHLLKGRTKAKQSFFILKGRLEGFFTNQNLNR